MRNSLASCPFTGSTLAIVNSGDPGVWGRLYKPDGSPEGEPFRISDEPGFCGWHMVAASAGQPKTWAVTYIVVSPGNPRVLRVVTPTSVSPAKPVVNVGSEWNYTERCGLAWTPQGWVVSVRLPGSPFGFPALVRVTHTGGTEAPVALAGPDDYRNGGALAYSVEAGVLCAVGFAAGTPGYTGGTWGRIVNGLDLTMVSGVLTLDQNAVCEDHAVTPVGGSFVAHWTRNNQSTTSRISRFGTFTPRVTMPSGGAYAVAYNEATNSILLAMKDVQSSLVARQLKADGTMTDPFDDLRLALWDGRVPDYHPSVCAVPGGWLLLAQFGEGQRIFRVRGQQGVALLALNTPVPPPAEEPKDPPAEPNPPVLQAIYQSSPGGDAPHSVQFQAVIRTGEDLDVTWKRGTEAIPRMVVGTFPASHRPVIRFDAPGVWSVSATVEFVGGEVTLVATVVVTTPPPPPPPPPPPAPKPKPSWKDLLRAIWRRIS